jgi:hypothetical protein
MIVLILFSIDYGDINEYINSRNNDPINFSKDHINPNKLKKFNRKVKFVLKDDKTLEELKNKLNLQKGRLMKALKEYNI